MALKDIHYATLSVIRNSMGNACVEMSEFKNGIHPFLNLKFIDPCIAV